MTHGPRADGFPVSELVRRAGVPRSTVHHYVKQRLLPPPRRAAGNRFLYDDGHVRTLRLIRVLRQKRRLSLAEIRRILPELLDLGAQEAFRPQMWEELLDRRRPGLPRTTRRDLVAAATAAFSNHSYSDVRVEDICAAAGLAKGSFYRYFNSKEDLYFEVVDEVVHRVTRPFDGLASCDEEQAFAPLVESLTPHMALLLELLSRALQDVPGHKRVASRAFETVTTVVGARVDPDRPVAAGGRVLQRTGLHIYFSAMSGPGPAHEEERRRGA